MTARKPDPDNPLTWHRSSVRAVEAALNVAESAIYGGHPPSRALIEVATILRHTHAGGEDVRRVID